MKTAMKNKRYFLLSIAALLVILMTGCASSADSEPSVAVTDDPVISESSNEETVSTSVTAVESKAETTAEETISESTIKESLTEETTDEISNDISIEVADTTTEDIPEITAATSAELTAPTPSDTSGDIIQLDLNNIKQSYDTSYGSEIACATFVLNYLGFNVDEATLASYLSPADDSLSYIPSSAIESAIEDYLSDIGVQEYNVSTNYLLSDMFFLDGYPSIVWGMPLGSHSEQCFVLIGHHVYQNDLGKYSYILYNPYDGTINEYSYDDISPINSEFDITVKRK